jgi:hypothetical protein
MSIGKLTGVSVTGGQVFALAWDDGRTATVDLASVIAGRKVLAGLADPAVFAAAALSDDGWSVEWPHGIDFGAPQLRRWADEQAGEIMAASAFRCWLESHGFTLERAAEALGVSRRTIAYYLSGEQPVPKTVMLATEGFDRRMAA